ncbi:MAG: hypothetical protein ABDH28_00870 [Brevinematia bacterium]
MRKIRNIIIISLMIHLVILLTSCVIGSPEGIVIGPYVWFIPEWVPTDLTNIELQYYYPDFTFLTPNRIYLDSPNSLSILTTIRASNKMVRVPIYQADTILASLTDPLEVRIRISISQDTEGEKEITNLLITVSNQTNSTYITRIYCYPSGNDFSVGSSLIRAVLLYYPSATSSEYRTNTFLRNAWICKGGTYYVCTIPLSNNMANFPDTILYLYKIDQENIIRIASDDNSGYSNKLSKLHTSLSPGEYLIKVAPGDKNTIGPANPFAVYFGKREITVSSNDSFHEFTNYLPVDAVTLIQDIPTNTFIPKEVPMYFKFTIPE